MQPVLLVLEPSRVLGYWWCGLHGFIGCALWLSPGKWGLAGLLPLVAHWRWRRPPGARTLIVSDGRCFSLLLQGRFGLGLTPACTRGPGWIRLVFSDQPDERMLILRDQVDGPGWRHLVLALSRSD